MFPQNPTPRRYVSSQFIISSNVHFLISVSVTFCSMFVIDAVTPAPVDRLMQRKGAGAFLQKFVPLFIYLIIQITFRESILAKPILGAKSIEVKKQSMSLLSCLQSGGGKGRQYMSEQASKHYGSNDKFSITLRPTPLDIQDTGLGLIDTESKVKVLITQFSSVQSLSCV